MPGLKNFNKFKPIQQQFILQEVLCKTLIPTNKIT